MRPTLGSFLLSVALTVVLPGCSDPAADGRDDDFVSDGKADGSIVEGSPEALGVLEVANTLDKAALDNDVGLDARAAAGIAAHRAGADKMLGTSDDDDFDTLVELDKVPYVGPIAFSKLLAYAQAHGLVQQSSGAWQLENPSPDDTVRHGVWATSASDVWSVGRYGFIEHWDGTSWKTIPSGVDVSLSAVWASSANDVWVVGQAGTVLHWNGSAFTPVASTTTRTLRAVHGTSKDDVWMVGDNDSGAFAGEILHWDGSQMTKKRTSGCPNTLDTVFAKAPDDVWVGGEVKTICHWNGSTWQEQFPNSPNQSSVTSLWRGASTWAVFDDDIYRLDGTTWTHQYSVPRPGTWQSVSLFRITGTSDTDLWATGSHGFVVHYDGTTWTPTRLPGNAYYESIAMAGGDAWAVGNAAKARLHNGTWNESYNVVSRQWLWSSAGTSPSNLWVIGSEGDIIRRTSSGWSAIVSPWADEYLGMEVVYAAGSNDVWFGGYDHSGHWDGTTISTVTELRDVRAFWGASPTDLWAAGESGLSHYDGTTWTKDATPTPKLFGIAGTSSTDVWAIGSGTLMHYDGTAWTTVDAGIGTYEDWNTIVALAPDDVWIAGESKNLRHFDGTSWTAFPATTKDRPWFRSAYAKASDDIYFVLSSDSLVHWNGSTLETESMPGASTVIGFGSQLFVTGEDGVVKHR